ncbi:DNA alkylation response protein [Henriciella mobilis]|uniref:acyl-CoA dehydrogenase family protein n=1 Tax=Henriciella mobilis TaxID=2305467 RepID=UPI000E662D49|nr:acyl-CoA dehydrogenase family protein [Henriciella mobilis]RIJ18320.1 DNA alkylation response protein [Henriciella mobilis]RIJ24876.1 DNA alkylation response protein [Henriciella mobilis]
MTHHAPIAELETHTVTNQPQPLEESNLFGGDRALRSAVSAFGGDVHAGRLGEFGKACGSAEAIQWGRQANENPPRLKSFDRYGHRLDEVEFHPAYHQLMALGLDHGISGAPWQVGEAGHVLHGAMMIMMMQADAGVTCPMSMTYACVAALGADEQIASTWSPRVTAQSYDPRFIPADRKTGVTIGMAMTEKQGGSDVRANTTKAEPAGDGGYILTGHKWFCSAPMSDAFLTLAYAEGGMTCFLVPRWRPDGTRNAIHIMRLKDKMGDKSNASSEIEYHGAWAERLGEEGRGVRTIIDMVQHTRYDCTLGSAGGMRAALAQALWHTSQRRAFQKALIDQPAMRAVLADLALESEAATAVALRIGASLDRARTDPDEAAFMRLATPIAKYWVCKRQPGFVYEALECHGGAGFVEEGPMPRLFRQSPLNAIWEGSGNVIALDILRALSREPESLKAVEAELETALGVNDIYDRHCASLADFTEPGALHEGSARAFAQAMALALQAAALKQTAPDFVFHGFCAQRLASGRRGFLYGDVDSSVDQDALIERAMPG